jgi:hypothetical protein
MEVANLLTVARLFIIASSLGIDDRKDWVDWSTSHYINAWLKPDRGVDEAEVAQVFIFSYFYAIPSPRFLLRIIIINPSTCSVALISSLTIKFGSYVFAVHA